MDFKIVPWYELVDRKFEGKPERGRRYAGCHSSFAYPFLALSGLVRRTVWEMNPDWKSRNVPPAENAEQQAWRDQYYHECATNHHDVVQTLKTSRWGDYVSWNYAGDLGLRYEGVSYINPWNFVLDLTALTREGITVDCTPVLEESYRELTDLERIERAEDEWMSSVGQSERGYY